MKIAILTGTRPDIIKMAPVFHEGIKRKQNVYLIHSGQHYSKELYQDVYDDLNLPKPKYKLSIKSNDEHNSFIMGKMISNLSKVLKKDTPNILLVHGDTMTAVSGALAAHYNSIPVGHIEAGLRTGSREPFPEQTDTKLIGVCADLHFAPTLQAKIALINEGKKNSHIFITGNTSIDTVHYVKERKNKNTPFYDVYFSSHREENMRFKNRFINIVNFASYLSESYNVLWALRPKTKKLLKEYGYYEKLSKKLHFSESLPYSQIIYILSKCKFAATDSGGIQEEMSALGKPCITLRYVTDRSETIGKGNFLAKPNNLEKMKEVEREVVKSKMKIKCPYGNGHASKKIFDILLKNKKNLIKWEK